MTQTVAGRDDRQSGEEDWKKKCHPESKFKAVEKKGMNKEIIFNIII